MAATRSSPANLAAAICTWESSKRLHDQPVFARTDEGEPGVSVFFRSGSGRRPDVPDGCRGTEGSCTGRSPICMSSIRARGGSRHWRSPRSALTANCSMNGWATAAWPDISTTRKTTLSVARFQTFDFEGMDQPEVLEPLLFYILHRANASIYDRRSRRYQSCLCSTKPGGSSAIPQRGPISSRR